MATDLNKELMKKTKVFSLKVWVLIGIGVGVSIVIILFVLSLWLISRRKSRRTVDKLPFTQIPTVSKEIKEVRVEQISTQDFVPGEGIRLTIHDKSNDKESDRVLVHLGMGKSNGDNSSESGSFHHVEKDGAGSQSEDGGSGNFTTYKPSFSYHISAPSPLVGLPEFSQQFVGVVYRGQLINGTPVAVKKLLNNLGQAEKEFKVEVETIGHVQHKNLVRLLGYCVEGTHRKGGDYIRSTGLLMHN